MGISVVGYALEDSGTAAAVKTGKASEHLQNVLSGVLYALADAASGEPVGDFERTTWHLQMACNYLKLAASETGVAAADAVDAARDRLSDELFWLQVSLVRGGETGDRSPGLLAGLRFMTAVSSLLPAALEKTLEPDLYSF